MLATLLENSAIYIGSSEITHKRYFYGSIQKSDKRISIVGSKGVGKTTYILDCLSKLSLSIHKKLYMSADNIMLANTTLLDIAKEFFPKGGEILAIDEMHKYKNFQIELKQLNFRT